MLKYLNLMLINVKCSLLTNFQYEDIDNNITPLNISFDSQFDPIKFLNQNNYEINELKEIRSEYIFTEDSEVLNFANKETEENTKEKLTNLQHHNTKFCNVIEQSTIQTNTEESNSQESSFDNKNQNLNKKYKICPFKLKNGYLIFKKCTKRIKISNETSEKFESAIIYNSNPAITDSSEECNEIVHSLNERADDFTSTIKVSSIISHEKNNATKKACKNFKLSDLLGKRKSFEEDTNQESQSFQNSLILKSKMERVNLINNTNTLNESDNVKNSNLIFEKVENNLLSFIKESKNFIRMIEQKFNRFLGNKVGNTNLNINKVLYNYEFIVIDNCDFSIFGSYNIKDNSLFKQISTTFDCLNSFINELEITQNEIDF